MFCCGGNPWDDPKSAYNKQTSDEVSSYPGQRRFVKTGGNALAAAPSSIKQETNKSNSRTELVSVTVPHGVSPGQAIQVQAPDGSERIVSAIVPPGMTTGSSFMVNFPPRTSSAVPSSVVAPSVVSASSSPATADDVSILPPPTAPFQPDNNSFNNLKRMEKMVMVHVPPGAPPGTTLHVQVPGENRTVQAVVPPGVSQFHVKVPPEEIPVPIPPPYTAMAAPPPVAPAHVPSPHDDIPFSMALDAAPPKQRYPAKTSSYWDNTFSQQHSSFSNNGEYSSQNSRLSTSGHSVSAPAPTPAPAPAPMASQGEKLILVRVPPGTRPGTTLHVQIPDEPGRLLSAQVPPDVKEFHVSYKPSNAIRLPPLKASPYGSSNVGYSNGGSMNANAYAYDNGNSNNRSVNASHYSNNGQNSKNTGGGVGDMVLPLLGGIAMGGAAMAVFDHAHHSGGDD